MESRHKLQKELKVFIGITFFVMILELTGGFVTNSLALVSDSAHVFIDFLALLLTYFSFQISKKEVDEKYTFGYFRAEIIAAILNGIILAIASIFILYEAYKRFFSPEIVSANEVIVISIAGLIANTYVLWRMRHFQSENPNTKAAYLHVLSDTISSFGVILAAFLIILTGNYVFDALISAVIVVFVLLNAFGLLKESVHVIMEGTPKNINIVKLSNDMKKIKGVNEVHDMHVWSIASGILYLSAHVMIDSKSMKSANSIVEKINKMLKSKHKIIHSVIQSECDNCAANGHIHK